MPELQDKIPIVEPYLCDRMADAPNLLNTTFYELSITYFLIRYHRTLHSYDGMLDDPDSFIDSRRHTKVSEDTLGKL